MKLKALQEKRNKIAASIEELRNKFNDAGQTWGDEEQRKAWDAASADYDQVSREMDEVRSAEEVDRRANEIAEQQRRSVNERSGIPGREDRRPDERRDDGGQSPAETRELALGAWFKRQMGGTLTDAEREACQQSGVRLSRRSLDVRLSPCGIFEARQREARGLHPAMLESRNLSLSAGASTIPRGFVPRLEDAMLAYGAMLQVAEVMTTDTGNSLPWPTGNDTGNTGELLGEAASVGSSVDPSFSSVTLDAYKFSSKLVKVSTELLEDSAFNLAQYIPGKLGERLGRVLNSYMTTGTGSSQPNGLVTAATLGKTAASATAIASDELIELMHSVDPAYRNSPGVRWMMHDAIVLALRKLKDSEGRYVWQSGMQLGIPDTLFAYPITVNQAMASAMAIDAKTVLFGDLSKYKARMVRTMRIKRLDERYADTDEVAFIAFQRADGDLIDAGTHPVKFLKQAAS